MEEEGKEEEEEEEEEGESLEEEVMDSMSRLPVSFQGESFIRLKHDVGD
jgi:hypothetical protein